MARRGNIKNIVDAALDAEYYDEYGGEGYGGEYDNYGDEVIAKPKKGKKGKNNNPMAYEKDMSDDDDKNNNGNNQQEDEYEKQIRQAMEESKKTAPPKKPKGPDPQVIQMLVEQFEGYFSPEQAKDYLINNKLDMDLAMEAMVKKKTLNEQKGKKNFKKTDHVQREEQKKIREEEEKEAQKERALNQKYNKKEKDFDYFEQLDPEILNQIYGNIDYGVLIDQNEIKRDINLVIIGHVDAGKSTIMGHLLHKLGQISAHQIKKNTKLTEEYGKASFEFAYIMDEDEEERQRGITINTATAFFKTKNKNFSIIDAPGHVDFISNMITGASQAECGLLVIDAHTGAYEKGWNGGSTKDHAIIARSLGVQQLVIAVNKLDMDEWKEERFDQISQEVLPFLESIGFKKSNVQFVPLSGLLGMNLDSRDTQPPELQSWYNASKGRDPKCLIDAIDNFKKGDKPFNKPTRVCVYDYFKGNQDGFSLSSGDCVSAKIESGVVHEKQELILMPQNEKVIVNTIEFQKRNVAHCIAGQICDISLKIPTGYDSNFIKPGSVLCDPEYPINQIKKFQARIMVYDVELPLVKGLPCILYCFSHKTPCKIKTLEAIVDQSKNYEIIKTKPKFLKKGNMALITILLDQRICLELNANNKSMGRIALRDGNKTIAAGIVTKFIL